MVFEIDNPNPTPSTASTGLFRESADQLGASGGLLAKELLGRPRDLLRNNAQQGLSVVLTSCQVRFVVRILGFSFLCLSAALAPNRLDAQPDQEGPPAPVASRSAEQIAKQARASVVVISVEGREGGQAGTGTGFVVSDEGLIATNLHVIGEARPLSVQMADGSRLKVKGIHAWDRSQDLAIVRVDPPNTQMQPLPLAKATKVEDGQSIVVMGNPYGLRHSVVAGVVSGTREIEGRTMLQLAISVSIPAAVVCV